MFFTLRNKILSCDATFNIFVITLICLAGIIIYSNTFQSPFLFDDASRIVENDTIKKNGDLYAIWKYDPTHFITYLSLALNYHCHQLHVFGYHLANLIIHLSTAILVWRLVSLTFLTPAMKGDEIALHHRWIALFSGLLFVSHPIQTEAVTYITQRGTSLAAFFYIGSLCFYLNARLLKDNSSHSGVWKWHYGLSLVMAVLGIFTKQIVITLPLIIIVYEFCFLRENVSQPNKIQWKHIIPFLVLASVIPLNQFAVLKTKPYEVSGLTMETDTISRLVYLLTQFRVLVTYLRLLFLPLNQNLDYDYPLSQTLWTLHTLSSLLFLLLFLSMAIMLFRKYRLIAFSIFWFFLTLSVESSLIPIQDVIYEHRLYLPLVSYSIFLPAGLYYLLERRLWPGKGYCFAALILLVSFYSVLTYARNQVWQSEFALWDDTVSKSPGKSRPYTNRGIAYEKKGDYKSALCDFNRAIEIRLDCVEAYNGRGITYKDMGLYDKALLDFNRAIEIVPDYTKAYYNRGNVYQQMKDYDRARVDYNQVLLLDDSYTAAYYNRAIIYEQKGQYDKAIADYNQAIAMDPGYAKAYYNRGNIYQQIKDYNKTIADYNQAIAIDPGYAKAYNNRGTVYLKEGLYDKAVLDFDKAVGIEPGCAEAYNNRGIVYAGKREYDKSIAEYTQAVTADPDYADAYYNRALVFLIRKEYDRAWADIKQAQRLGYHVEAQLLNDIQQGINKK